MKYMGIQISEDGATIWRNNGGCIERRFVYASDEWEDVMNLPCTPTNARELEEYCKAGNFDYLPPKSMRVIPQKMSGAGSIHDVQSDQYDRKIVFAPGCVYAVIDAAYYGGKGHSTHATKESVIAASNKNKDYSHIVVDIAGQLLMVDEGELREDFCYESVFEPI